MKIIQYLHFFNYRLIFSTYLYINVIGKIERFKMEEIK